MDKNVKINEQDATINLLRDGAEMVLSSLTIISMKMK